MKFNAIITSTVAVAAVCNAAAVRSQKALVDSTKLQSMIKKENLLAKAKQLQDIADRNDGTRKWGSPGHVETLKWIADYLSRTGYYDIEWQGFNRSRVDYDKFSLKFSDGTKPGYFLGVTDPKEGHFEAELVYLPDCKAETISNKSNQGKIGLINPGRDDRTCGNATEVVSRMHEAGLIGLIAATEMDETPDDQPSLAIPKDMAALMPILITNNGTGTSLIESLSKNSVQATMDIIGYRNVTKTTYNLIAETKGGDHSKVITSGAHSDSVPFGPGINDDGSGLITQMEVAGALANFEIKNAVRWYWWTAEEAGIVGSKYYTENLSREEQDKIVLHMDFDMLASPNFMYAVYDGSGSAFPDDKGPAGSEHLQETFTSFYRSNNITARPFDLDGRSDYVSFQKLGIPVGGVKTGVEGLKTANETALYGGETGQPYDKCYHRACDTIENLAMDAWEMNSKCVTDAIARYATSIEGIEFPRKGNTTVE